ncbi:MAG: hypothetical protein LAT78_06685 [Roseinatronobacter sp.]|nr:hypothetical protein [Roseinatronobacter sp.]
MFEDYSERLFAHFVAGQWRAPFGSVCLPVPMPDGRGCGQIVPAGPRDVARAVAALHGAGSAATQRFADRLAAALPELIAAFALDTTQIDFQQICPHPSEGGVVLLGIPNTALAGLLPSVLSRLQDGVILCPAPEQAVLATAIATIAQAADLPPGAFALLQARIPSTEAALRSTGLQLHEL